MRQHAEQHRRQQLNVTNKARTLGVWIGTSSQQLLHNVHIGIVVAGGLHGGPPAALHAVDTGARCQQQVEARLVAFAARRHVDGGVDAAPPLQAAPE